MSANCSEGGNKTKVLEGQPCRKGQFSQSSQLLDKASLGLSSCDHISLP